jgi:hypothetical protein
VSFLGPGVTTVPAGDTSCSQITPEIGITATPVIDPASGTIYVVAMTKEVSGSTTSYVQRLHALDITSGAERPGSPVAVQASVPGTGDGGATVTFNPKSYKLRPGLLLLNNIVYTSWSSHCDIGSYHGWIIGYNALNLAQAPSLTTEPPTDSRPRCGRAAPAPPPTRAATSISTPAMEPSTPTRTMATASWRSPPPAARFPRPTILRPSMKAP